MGSVIYRLFAKPSKTSVGDSLYPVKLLPYSDYNDTRNYCHPDHKQGYIIGLIASRMA